MASLSSLSLLFLLLLLLTILYLSSAATSRPKALVLPITKDARTLQYLIHFKHRTVLISFTLDLGGRSLWVGCGPSLGFFNSFQDSSFQDFILCGSRQCLLAKSDDCRGCYSPRLECNTQTCHVSIDSISMTVSSALVYDTFSFVSTDGSTPGAAVAAPQFIFACTDPILLKSLASGTAGMAGLGRNAIGLPTQLAVAFRMRRLFAICLPSSTSSDVKGVAFFGPGPYRLLSNTDASQSLTYTPLIINPVAEGFYIKGDKSDEYFIKVSSIKVNNKPIQLNQTLLLINKKGYGGTKISTVTPYTTLETSIYTTLTRAFVTALAKVKRVRAVSPFKVCYNAKDLGSTRVGVAVPAIDLVLQKESVYWTIFGANSMVRVSDNVLCLGFLDGGMNPRTSIVIGGHQIEDNLLQFDLGKSVLGFSSSLLFRQTTCANFNFTSTSLMEVN